MRTSARTNCLSHQLDADFGSLSLLIDKTQRERTALHAAAAGGHETIAGVLLENGADPGAKAQVRNRLERQARPGLRRTV